MESFKTRKELFLSAAVQEHNEMQNEVERASNPKGSETSKPDSH